MMTPAEAINAATINAAHALRVQARVGSLEVGKQADVIIFDTPIIGMWPANWERIW